MDPCPRSSGRPREESTARPHQPADDPTLAGAYVFESISRILSQLINVPAACISARDSLTEDLNLDSLLMLEFLVTAEEAFSIPLFDIGRSEFTSVGQVVSHVAEALDRQGHISAPPTRNGTTTVRAVERLPQGAPR
jgi:acyl carrier protein